MAAELIWRPLARNDLLQIYEFVGLDNPAAAERLYEAIENKVARLRSHPRMGTRRPDLSPTARILIVENVYLILYQTHPDTDEGAVETVEINRIVDGRRNLRESF
jgi:toxin ParE1/3/4